MLLVINILYIKSYKRKDVDIFDNRLQKLVNQSEMIDFLL